MSKENKPIILIEGQNTAKDLADLSANNPIISTIDTYQQQLAELFEISNANLIGKENFLKMQSQFIKERSVGHQGNWTYFPWNGSLIHMLNEEDYFKLRTNRNRNLITEEEQEILNNFNVGVAGLSVGSNIALSLAYQGISNSMKLAEFDTLETTNLNRIRAGIMDLGKPKIEITARQIYEVNPYAELSLYPKGLKKEFLDKFFEEEPKPKLVFEIIDDFEMKVLLRLKARELGITVIVFANLGDSILLDIERYDLDKEIPLFNGVIGNLTKDILEKPDDDRNKYAVAMVGLENVPQRALESVKEINKTLVGRPQLSGTVTIASGLASYIAKEIALGNLSWGGRKLIKFNELIG